jgi:hypothetical protein
MHLVFFLVLSPLFLGFQISGDFILYPGLIIWLIYLVKDGGINKRFIALAFFILFLIPLTKFNVVSSFYYYIGLYLLFKEIAFKQAFIEKSLNIFIILTAVVVLFDLIDFQIIEYLTNYERRYLVDDRLIFSIKRAVALQRESGDLALILGMISVLFYKFKLKIYSFLLFILGTLTFSPMFFILWLFGFIFYSSSRNKLQITSLLICLPLFILLPRLQQLWQLIYYNFDSIMYLNLSEVKRWVHPVIAVKDFLTLNPNWLIGLGPGNYDEWLISNYYFIVGSDLSVGNLLNIISNFVLSYGLLFGLIFILVVLLSRKTFSDKFIFLFILFQGMALIHPVIFLMNIKVNKE